MNWLQIRLSGPYFNSFSTNSYGYYSQKSQNLFSNGQIFASAKIVNKLRALPLTGSARDLHPQAIKTPAFLNAGVSVVDSKVRLYTRPLFCA